MTRPLHRRVAARVLAWVPGDTVVRVVRGRLRGARWVFGSGTHGCWAGIFERTTQELLAVHVKSGAVVWDVGANVGFFTLLASRLVSETGCVVAFEPVPRNADLMRRHVALNDVRNVMVREVALSDLSGTSRLDEGANSFSGRLSASGGLNVTTERGDDLVRAGQVPAPNFMKIDVEGAESRVLEGCANILRSARPVIVLSAHGWQQHELCARALQMSGYSVDTKKDGREDGDYLVVASPLEG